MIHQGIPPPALEITISSLSESSLKNYDVALKKWWSFCNQTSIDLYNPSIREIILFLSDQYEKGLSYSSINCIRSAISLIVSVDCAEDSRVKRFFKGISNLRPSRPKYDQTWDPKIILDFYNDKAEDKDLSLKDLSKKLIVLLALTTGHRMQTLSLINITNLRRSETQLEIHIPDRIKTSRRGSTQPLLILPFYSNRKLCVATTLISYLDMTLNLRGSIDKLFISFKKPFKAVCAQTLSRWIKDVLSEAGVDTTKFSAHSTRHASTSAAKRAGVDIELIRKTAGWSKNSKTFARFYNRDVAVDSRQFALSILDS